MNSNLGWKASTSCGRFERLQSYTPFDTKHWKIADLNIDADHSAYQGPTHWELTGHVQLRLSPWKMQANRAHILLSRLGEILTITLTGNVCLYSPSQRLCGEYVVVDLPGKRLSGRGVVLALGGAKGVVPFYWGKSDHFVLKDQTLSLGPGLFTSCDFHHPSWTLRAKGLILHRDQGMATAESVRWYWHQWPLFAWNRLRFATDKRRHSGWLGPSVGIRSHHGVEMVLPYYFNLAPNQDATGFLRPMWHRGVQWGGNYRYLWPHQHGQLQADVLLDDRVFKAFAKTTPVDPNLTGEGYRLQTASANRYAFRWRHYYSHQPWEVDVDWTSTSDPYYFKDLNSGHPFSYPYSRDAEEIERHVRFTHLGRWPLHFDWNFWRYLPRVDVNPHWRHYNEIPKMDWSPEIGHWRSDIELVRFRLPGFQPTFPTPAIEADRLSLRGSWHTKGMWREGNWEFQWGADARAYQFFQVDKGNRTVIVPFAQWQWDKKIKRWDWRWQWTYVPFVRQDDIPIFTPRYVSGTWEDLFAINRLRVDDRWGDLHRLSIGGRYGDANTHWSIGQEILFSDYRVGVCFEPGCQIQTSGREAQKLRLGRFALDWQYRQHQAHLTWDNDKHHIQSLSYQYTAHWGENTKLNASYQWLFNGNIDELAILHSRHRQDVERLHLDIDHHFDQWGYVAGIDQNIAGSYLDNISLGLNYFGCCFRLGLEGRLHWQGFSSTGRSQYSRQILLTWQLLGITHPVTVTM